MISEERLRQAAHVAGDAMLAALPLPEECQHDFSAAFERKMRRVLRRGNHPGLYRGFQRVASFLLALLVGCGVWLSVDAQAREAFFGWVSERLDNAQHYFFSGSTEATPDTVRYVLTQIPDGYEPFDLYDGNGFVSNTYTNSAEQGFSFEYIMGDATEMFLLIGEEAEGHTVSVHGKAAEFYPARKETESSTIVWKDEETGALLYISGFFEENYLIELAESVIKEEK